MSSKTAHATPSAVQSSPAASSGPSHSLAQRRIRHAARSKTASDITPACPTSHAPESLVRQVYNRHLLDASAVIAVLRREPGAARIAAIWDDAAITTVNLAEVIGRFARLPGSRTEALAIMRGLAIPVTAIVEEDALSAGLMRADTDAWGLSLGDRFCLAVARRLNAVAVTTDRAWAEAAGALGVEVLVAR